MVNARSRVVFKNFDDPTVYNEFEEAVSSFGSRNFVLEFDRNSASGAFNVDENDIEQLLFERKSLAKENGKLPTRWINVWLPEKQKGLLKRLANHYGFSPRLLSSMCCEHMKPLHIASSGKGHRQHLWNRKDKKEAISHVLGAFRGDVESHETIEIPLPQFSLPDINHYTIVSEVWHFASVDWGYKFTCIGFNSLYNTHEHISSDKNRPAGKRLWSWLVLCDDTIHENPYPDPRDLDAKELQSVRFNLINVFKQLSKVTDERGTLNPIMTVHIRPGLQSTSHSEMHVLDEDGPSLLFHYLFDDWLTTYSLVSRKEHQYGDRLEKVRVDMAESQNSANLENINRLHHYGRQLAVLKRIYESYHVIIERILSGPQSGRSSSSSTAFQKHPPPFNGSRSPVEGEHKPISEGGSGYGVPVSTAAAVRFERLKDRINLYALSEIQECLDEKESLVMLIFNLLTLKESSYVERLTRITIFFAKFSVLFIPVSLMSTYFSINLADVGSYSLGIYWTAFGVVFALSLVGLVLFGYVSGSLEGTPVYRSVSRRVIDTGKGVWRRLQNVTSEKTV